MTVYENIRFPLRMRQVPTAEPDRLVRDAAKLVELDEFLDRKLSGGQRQRAALARAIVRHPQVFLMDEPLSNLDARHRQAMRVQIKHLQRHLKTTTVYVTHDQIEAMTLADRIVIMETGAIQQTGTPDEIYSDPANTFVAGFIGSPPMNLVSGHVQEGVFRAPGDRDRGGTAGTASSGDISLGIRPEDCRVVAEGGNLQGSVFGIEPTGDIPYLTVQCGDRLVEVKAARDFRSPLGVPVAVGFDPDRLYFFDSVSGARLR